MVRQPIRGHQYWLCALASYRGSGPQYTKRQEAHNGQSLKGKCVLHSSVSGVAAGMPASWFQDFTCRSICG